MTLDTTSRLDTIVAAAARLLSDQTGGAVHLTAPQELISNHDVLRVTVDLVYGTGKHPRMPVPDRFPSPLLQYYPGHPTSHDWSIAQLESAAKPFQIQP